MSAHAPRTALPALLAALTLTAAAARADYTVPRPDHLVAVIEENHGAGQILGNPAAPYITALAGRSANFTQAYAIEHPSLPNYLDLFSGSNQGVTDDNAAHSFTAPNLGAQLLAAGLTFGGYSENQPGVGALDLTADGGLYARKHNPWSEFQGTGANQLPGSVNMPFTSFPTDYSRLPTVSFIAPNQINDMHGLAGGPTGNDLIATGDAWLKNNLDSYVQWARTHNSALWVVWDEDDFKGTNQVASFLYGPMFTPGNYPQTVNHYNLLATIEDMYGLPHVGNAALAPNVFAVPEPGSSLLLAVGGLAALFARRLRTR